MTDKSLQQIHSENAIQQALSVLPNLYDSLPENYWDFVMEWLPNYTHRDDVLGNDILTRYVEGELLEDDNANDIKEMQETYPTMELAKTALAISYTEFYMEASEAYREASKRINANVAAIIYHKDDIGWKHFINDMDKVIELATQYEKQYGDCIDWVEGIEYRKGSITSQRKVTEAECWDEHIIWFCKDKF